MQSHDDIFKFNYQKYVFFLFMGKTAHLIF